ncbi:MAG: hypothetical protein COA58_00965 [Bacteroidetes bacterium]|nr:MAG: hypothetical protein COA58_00965 [Bacteroidota bacterium]
MRKIGLAVALCVVGSVLAQNLELTSGKDIKQPGKLNPALAGVQEDLIRVLTDAEIGASYQFMLEGRMPLNLGNYMVGVERTFTDNVANNMFNITYGRSAKGDKALQWRYGGSLQFNQKSILSPGFDSTSGYTFTDLNGDTQSVRNLNDIKNELAYMDAEFGVTANFKNLIVGASVENILGQNVSLSKLSSRHIPFTANLMVGGFLNIGENVTIYPSAIAVFNKDDVYGKANFNVSTRRMNFNASYIQENEFQDISGSIAVRLNKIFAGIKYTHPITSASINAQPSFNLFFNSTIFKSRKFNKSDFALKMKKFY